MRLAALDLIRFFAAIAVVFYHYISYPGFSSFKFLTPVTDFMYLGVPLFFMISGYVIAISANNRNAFAFGFARFWRLYPTLWVSILFTVVVVSLLTDKSYSLWTILANFTLVNEYLGQPNIDEVYWTLKAELRFYLCVFLLILFGVFNKFKIWLSIWLLLTCMHLLIKQPFFMGWFITPYYSSFFIAGVLLFLIGQQGLTKYTALMLSISLVVSSMRGFEQVKGFIVDPSISQQYIAVVCIWFFYGMMYLLCCGKMAIKPAKWISMLGALTFPLYLIHNVAGKAIIVYFSSMFPEAVVITLTILSVLFFAWVITLVVDVIFSDKFKRVLIKCLRIRT